MFPVIKLLYLFGTSAILHYKSTGMFCDVAVGVYWRVRRVNRVVRFLKCGVLWIYAQTQNWLDLFPSFFFLIPHLRHILQSFSHSINPSRHRREVRSSQWTGCRRPSLVCKSDRNLMITTRCSVVSWRASVSSIQYNWYETRSGSALAHLCHLLKHWHNSMESQHLLQLLYLSKDLKAVQRPWWQKT